MNRVTRIAAIAVVVTTAGIFWRTAYPTVTWWDSSSYSLAAATLGIPSPPGSLLLTLLGWPVTRLSFGTSPAHALNLFAGLLAAFAAMLICLVALEMYRTIGRASSRITEGSIAIGAVFGALTFAFSTTPWDYAVKFTPYILSAVFTGLILWTMLEWWNAADYPGAWHWLAWLGVLFGLDFSVHRTNALLIPGAIVWILLRRPRTLVSARAPLAAAAGLAAGLAVQMLVIPLAAFAQSPLNFSDPSNLSRFWDYVTIKQLGGAFLLGVFPRKSPIWSAQTADLVHVLRENFLNLSGRFGILGVLPAIAAFIGLVVIWRGNRRLGAAFTLVLLVQASLTVLYFNIPSNYFRTFDRHYLPVCVTIAVLVAVGLAAAGERAAWLISERKVIAAVPMIALAASLPVGQVAANWSTHDASARYFTRDYAANALLGLPPNAIYFTVGDNDTFPVMYLQSVEGVRPDVTIINLSVANIPAWPDQLKRRDPSLPLSLSIAQRVALGARPWTDTAVVIPVSESPEHFALAPDTKLPASIALDVRPVMPMHMLPAEIVVLDIVRTNAWKRPLAFAVTGTRSAMEWLAPYGRIDGLYYRIIPVRNPPADPNVLRAHLLEVARYRGYADPAVSIDDVSRTMGMQSYAGLIELLEADRFRGLGDQCRADRTAVLAKLPLDRLHAPAEYRDQIESACGLGAVGAQ
jgi:hypothetical protein